MDPIVDGRERGGEGLNELLIAFARYFCSRYRFRRFLSSKQRLISIAGKTRKIMGRIVNFFSLDQVGWKYISYEPTRKIGTVIESKWALIKKFTSDDSFLSSISRL